MKLSYEEWMKKVDALCIKHVGMDVQSLEDTDTRSFYGDDLSPEEGLVEVLREQSIMGEDLLLSIADQLKVEL